jgi:hypothetical protein
MFSNHCFVQTAQTERLRFNLPVNASYPKMLWEIIIVATAICCFLIIKAVIRAWGGLPGQEPPRQGVSVGERGEQRQVDDLDELRLHGIRAQPRVVRGDLLRRKAPAQTAL